MTDRVIRSALGLIGVVCVGVGAKFLLERSHQEVISAAIWFTFPAILSDLVLLPIAAVVGHVLTKGLAAWARLPAQVAAVLIGTLLLIAVPYLGRPGLHEDNPTLLNRNYVAGYLMYVAIIVVLAAVWALIRLTRRDRPRRAHPAGRPDRPASPAGGTPQTDR
ncbi:sterol desaturase/sphingolipid hydroxylase (fatty acid hydroxylase superfamily) [Nakamurella sp. UYEF19]